MTFDKLINIKLSICVYLVVSERKHEQCHTDIDFGHKC